MKIMKVSKIFMASVLLIFGVVVKADYAEYKNDFIAAGKATFNEKDHLYPQLTRVCQLIL
jgi:hypothetical protein